MKACETYKARWGGVEHTAYFSATNAALLPDEDRAGEGWSKPRFSKAPGGLWTSRWAPSPSAYTA